MNYLGKYTLSDFFDRLFKILGKTWKTTLAVSAATYAAIGGLSALSMFPFLSKLAEFGPGVHKIESASEFKTVLGDIGGMLGLSFLTAIAGVIGLALVEAVCARSTWEAANGRDASLRATLKPAIKKNLVTIVLQQICIGMGLVIGMYALLFSILIPMGLLGVGTAAVAGSNPAAFGAVVAVIMILLIICVGLAMLLMQYAPTICVVEGKSAFAAIGECFSYMKRGFWRTLGISLLMYLAIPFAIGLVTLPIASGFLYPELERIAAQGAEGLNSLQSRPFELFGRMSAFFIAISFAGNVLMAMLYIPFKTLFVIDQKARRGDFAAPAAISDEDLRPAPSEDDLESEPNEGMPQSDPGAMGGMDGGEAGE